MAEVIIVCASSSHVLKLNSVVLNDGDALLLNKNDIVSLYCGDTAAYRKCTVSDVFKLQ